MRVGTRITVATSALVVACLFLFGLWDLRRQAAHDREVRLREARTIAFSLRAAIELRGVRAALADGPEFGRELTRAEPAWEVTVIAIDSVTVEPGLAQRLKTIREVRSTSLAGEEDGKIVYAVPLRVPSAAAPGGFEVAGVLQIAGAIDDLADARSAAWWRALAFLAIIGAIVFFGVRLFTRNLVTSPIAKLLAGVDDVARGDITSAILSEREDEIGMLATRFNEMTFSLRESQAETAKQNQARRGLEERLFQTEKLATIGQLAAEIAHEVGTPLNVISGRAKALGKKASDTESVKKNAGIIAEQSQRITRIIQRLLDLARRKIGSVEPEFVDMGAIAATTLEFLEGRLREAAVSWDLDREEALPMLRGQADQLQQVLLNLLMNACEAMPDGGSIRVTTSADTRRRPGLAEAAPESVVVVEVTDSGPGIPEAARERIFEPFYTSKDREGGTGLGLAVSHGIVKEHDGWIEVDDAKGGGTVFRVFFPVATQASNPPSA